MFCFTIHSVFEYNIIHKDSMFSFLQDINKNSDPTNWRSYNLANMNKDIILNIFILVGIHLIVYCCLLIQWLSNQLIWCICVIQKGLLLKLEHDLLQQRQNIQINVKSRQKRKNVRKMHRKIYEW